MFNGKQLLLSLLQKYSKEYQAPDKLSEVSEEIRAAFLLHGSTPNHMWAAVDSIEWNSYTNNYSNNDKIDTQGLGIKKLGFPLSEFFVEILREDKMYEIVQDRFPEINKKDAENYLWIIYLILRLLEWTPLDADPETGGLENKDAINKSMDDMKRKLKLFRKDPEDFLGLK